MRTKAQNDRFVSALAVGAVAVFFAIGATVACLTPPEKAVVRTVIEIAKAVCTEQDTLDACVNRILAERRQPSDGGVSHEN